MRMLAPVAISSVSLTSGQSPNLGHPVGNVLLDAPEVYFSVVSGSFEVALRAIVTGTINTFVLLGVISLAGAVTITDGAGAAVPGAAVTAYTDPYRAGRKNYWITFTQQTGTTLAFRIIIPMIVGNPAEVIRAGVLKAGITTEHTGLLFPLSEESEDPTPVMQMADGSLYRAAQLPVRRIFGATMRAARTTVESFVDTCRRSHGVPTMFHLAPELGDRYFVYGRMSTQPTADHSWPVVSNASFSVQEWV